MYVGLDVVPEEEEDEVVEIVSDCVGMGLCVAADFQTNTPPRVICSHDYHSA